MARYRLVVHRHGKRLGYFDTDAVDAFDAIRTIAKRLSPDEEFGIELHVSHTERRFLVSGPEGVQLLGQDPIFESATPALLEALRAEE